eukprot:76806_1
MVNKTPKINHVRFAADNKSVAFNANAPANAIKNIVPRINAINDEYINDEPSKPPDYFYVDTFTYFYNDIVADGANAVGQFESINHANGNINHDTNSKPINV